MTNQASSAHRCHAIGCETPVPPKLLMCRAHWNRVPKVLQAQVWAHYRPGQEVDKLAKRVPELERQLKDLQNFDEQIAETVSNMGHDRDAQAGEAQRLRAALELIEAIESPASSIQGDHEVRRRMVNVARDALAPSAGQGPS